MIASIILGLLLAADTSTQAPPVLTQREACRLAQTDGIPSGKSFAIRGHYSYDGHHGSILEIPECDDVFFPVITGEASAAVTSFHSAFSAKCGGILMGDSINGLFTGTFKRRKAQLFGMSEPMMIDFFEISRIDTKDLDASLIAC